MVAPSVTEAASRRKAAELLLALIESGATHADPSELMDNISVVKGLFNRAWRQDQRDWFRVQAQLGYPKWHQAKDIAQELKALRRALKAGNEQTVDQIRLRLRRSPIRNSLNVFLEQKIVRARDDAAWLLILSSPSVRDRLRIEISKVEYVNMVECSAPTQVDIEVPGVRSCWYVLRPAIVEREVRQKFAAYADGEESIYIIDYFKARRIITNILLNGLHEVSPLEYLQPVVRRPDKNGAPAA